MKNSNVWMIISFTCFAPHYSQEFAFWFGIFAAAFSCILTFFDKE